MHGIKEDINLQNQINALEEAGGGTHTVITLVVEGTDDNTTAEAIYGVNLVDLSSITDYCCKLPAGQTGKTVIIQNRSAGPIDVFPPDPLSQINQLGVGLPVQIPNDWKQYSFICVDNPQPSIWSLSAPSTFDIDSGVMEMTTHTESANGFNGANWTYGKFTKNPTPGGDPIYDAWGGRPFTSYSMPWQPGVQNGSIFFGAMPQADYFAYTAAPATLNKIKIYTNILDDNLLNSPNCSNGSLDVHPNPCYDTDLGTAGSNSDFGTYNGSPAGYMYGPILEIYRVQSTTMVTGTITTPNVNKIIDANQDFNLCFAGSPPLQNYSYCINLDAPWGTGSPSKGAIAGSVASSTELNLNQPWNQSNLGDRYAIKRHRWGDQTQQLLRVDLERGLCCFTSPSVGYPNYDCNTSWLPADYCNPYMDVSRASGGYNDEPGDVGTLYAEIDVTSSLQTQLWTNANRQIGAPPIQPNMIDGQSYYYFHLLIPAWMSTKAYKFQVIMECQ